MVLTALMVLVMLVGILVGYDMARLVLGRIKLQNGADAAVLAAVAVKVEKHHFDTAWRWAMQQEAFLGRMEASRAKLVFAQTALNVQNSQPGFVPVPLPVPGVGGPPTPGLPVDPGAPGQPPEGLVKAKEAFANRANKAYRHAAKLHQLDKTLLQLYQDWPTLFREASVEAADIAWQMNIRGFSDDKGPHGPNRDLLKQPGVLFDSQTATKAAGGIIYRNEGAWANATFGKSALQVEGAVQPLSGAISFVRVLPVYPILVNAGAQPIAVKGEGDPIRVGDRYVSKHETSLAKGLSVPGFTPKIQWHQPALFSLRGDEIKPIGGDGTKYKGPLH